MVGVGEGGIRRTFGNGGCGRFVCGGGKVRRTFACFVESRFGLGYEGEVGNGGLGGGFLGGVFFGGGRIGFGW